MISKQTKKKKKNLKKKGPNGIPIAGVLLYGWYHGSQKYHGEILPRFGQIVSYPTVMQQVMLINDPEIARKIYSNPDTLNRFEPFLESVSNTITFLNGDIWAKRRKNIHTHLISTINSRQVTKGSITFLKNVIFPYLDKHKMINDIRPILRPLTFNLVLYACVGKHIQSLDDQFFIKFDDLATKFWKNFRTRIFTSFLIGNGILYNLIFKRLFNLTKLGENIRKDMVKLTIFTQQEVLQYFENNENEKNKEMIAKKRFIFNLWFEEQKNIKNYDLDTQDLTAETELDDFLELTKKLKNAKKLLIPKKDKIVKKMQDELNKINKKYEI